ncbi:MAG: glycosyltransferase family 2 protein [Bryobacterales bacterium]|nr:glycosyltransferase family 2 protein [Bryobacterales bacterium]
MTITEVPHITVCICTYRRERYLGRLLERLAAIETDGLFTYSIVIVDNDRSRSAEPIVHAFRKTSPLDIDYVVEPRQNIARARNLALRNVRGEFAAFIDDDEFPTKHWLRTLFAECKGRQVDGVLGPVKPQYEVQPPKWVVTGGFYDRPSYPTGFIIDGSKGRTGNVLLRMAIIDGEPVPFRPEFRTGEDQDFFHRMIARGFVFTWCHEAVAYEWVPPFRWKRTFLLRRALLRGTSASLQSGVGAKDALRSVLAVPAYLILLPVALLLSHGIFMRYLVSLFDHLGKLMALVGINPIREQYVTE